MFNRNSESTEQLSARARCLLDQQVRKQLAETNINDDSFEKISQEDSSYAGRISVEGARRRLRAEWAELKGDRPSLGAPLAGVVALVCVRKDAKAVALRAALTALGATVSLKWSVLVTHLVWEPGADRSVRVKARRLNAHVVDPQWVEASAAKCAHAPERMFGARVRPSDPLDPPTMTRILKMAEKENIPLLEEESNTSSDGSNIKLRISDTTDASRNTSKNKSTDSSHNKSTDKSNEKSTDKSKNNTLDSSLAPSSDTRINTAPRKMHPISTSPMPLLKSRRKLFTDLEEKDSESSDSEQDKENRVRCKNPYDIPRHRKTRRRKQRRDISEIGKRNAKQKDQWTVDNSLLRLLIEEPKKNQPQQKNNPVPTQRQPYSQSTKCKARIVLSGMSRTDRSHLRELAMSVGCAVDPCVSYRTTHVVLSTRRRTLAALEGAVRGCWLVEDRFIIDSAKEHSLADPREYQVEEFRKTSNKARIERTALQLRKYELQVFADLRICVEPTLPHAAELVRLLQLCGATIIQGLHDEEQADITIGNPAECAGQRVVARWVSDSVSAGRARSTRFYRAALSHQHSICSTDKQSGNCA